MLGSLTSLTGGGGMSASSSAQGGSGDQSGRLGGFQVGGLNMGGGDNQLLVIGLVAFVAWLALKK